MSSALGELLSILQLAPMQEDTFYGYCHKTALHRVFGGQLIAQALLAASRTVEGFLPYSIHANFLALCDPEKPILYGIERTRDGRNYATRRVVARQQDTARFAASVSLSMNDEAGFDCQQAMPQVAYPDDLPSTSELRAMYAGRMSEAGCYFYSDANPIELKPVEYRRYLGDRSPNDRFHIWFRAAAPLPADDLTHRAILAFASDMTILDAALLAPNRTFFDGTIMPASLDHAVWFHRPARVDEWHLFAQDGPSLFGARGFSRGLIFSGDGNLVASVAQEGVLRRVLAQDDDRGPRQ